MHACILTDTCTCSEDKDYFEKLISHQMFKPDPRLRH